MVVSRDGVSDRVSDDSDSGRCRRVNEVDNVDKVLTGEFKGVGGWYRGLRPSPWNLGSIRVSFPDRTVATGTLHIMSLVKSAGGRRQVLG